MNTYRDILHLPHHVSETRAPMPRMSRAAQFAPFAALTGYDDAIDETVRLTDTECTLDADEAERLDRRLRFLQGHLSEQPSVTVTYFRPDDRKAGGAYLTVCGKLQRIDCERGRLIFTDRTEVPLDRICALYSIVFPSD